jgi:hypothetical protein
MRRGVLWVPYCFEKDVKFFSPNSIVISKFIDFYKADHFILEAKQEGTTSGKGTAKRGTLTYQNGGSVWASDRLSAKCQQQSAANASHP